MPYPTKLTETKLKQKIFRIVKSQYPNCYIRKISDRFHAGILDLIICNEGNVIFIELKLCSNCLTPLQKKEIEEIKQAGGTVYCLWATEDGQNFFLDGRIHYSLETLLKEML